MKKNVINKLTDLSDLVGTCGKYGSLQCDGDGLIALYNAAQLLNVDITLEELNQECIKRRAIWFGGTGYFKVFKIKRVLKTFGIHAKFQGFFRSYTQTTNSHKFIIVYWQKGLYGGFGDLKFQAGDLVIDKKGAVWLELFNPFHHYDSIKQFKLFEGALLPLLFTVD